MKPTSFIITTVLASCTTAAVLPRDDVGQVSRSRFGRTVISYVAKFDDANAGLLADLPVRGLTPLGPYDSLYYNNLGVIADDTTGDGVDPVSPPNVLAYDLVAALQGPQNITSRYIDSITDYFNFKSFYFGCLVSTEETATSVPTSCTISLTGYLNGKEVATQDASFTAGLTEAKMQRVFLSRGFAQVDTVVFKTNGLVGEVAEAALFDNLEYDAVLLQGH